MDDIGMLIIMRKIMECGCYSSLIDFTGWRWKLWEWLDYKLSNAMKEFHSNLYQGAKKRKDLKYSSVTQSRHFGQDNEGSLISHRSTVEYVLLFSPPI